MSFNSITPRGNSSMFGHDDVANLLLSDVASSKLSHAMIFSGDKGIGKATMAYRFTRALLSGNMDMELAENDPVFHRINANSHSDLLVIEPVYDEKKGALAKEITIEQSRLIASNLSLTPAEGAWRVVIIDSVDNLNNNSANSILKILEEPPERTVIILISHNIGRLLPTIRSRCRVIPFKPLSYDDFVRVINLHDVDIDSSELSVLSAISKNSPSLALELKENGVVDIYDTVASLIYSENKADILKFCDNIWTGSKAHANWRLFNHIVLCLLERVVKKSSGYSVQAVSDAEEGALAKLSSLYSADIWAKKWQEASEQFAIADNLHLDLRQVAFLFFESLPSRKSFSLRENAA
ncbi:MAG: DNA polymerase III subunit delta' [Rickettsiales bacterium]